MCKLLKTKLLQHFIIFLCIISSQIHLFASPLPRTTSSTLNSYANTMKIKNSIRTSHEETMKNIKTIATNIAFIAVGNPTLLYRADEYISDAITHLRTTHILTNAIQQETLYTNTTIAIYAYHALSHSSNTYVKNTFMLEYEEALYSFFNTLSLLDHPESMDSVLIDRIHFVYYLYRSIRETLITQYETHVHLSELIFTKSFGSAFSSQDPEQYAESIRQAFTLKTLELRDTNLPNATQTFIQLLNTLCPESRQYPLEKINPSTSHGALYLLRFARNGTPSSSLAFFRSS